MMPPPTRALLHRRMHSVHYLRSIFASRRGVRSRFTGCKFSRYPSKTFCTTLISIIVVCLMTTFNLPGRGCDTHCCEGEQFYCVWWSQVWEYITACIVYSDLRNVQQRYEIIKCLGCLYAARSMLYVMCEYISPTFDNIYYYEQYNIQCRVVFSPSIRYGCNLLLNTKDVHHN